MTDWIEHDGRSVPVDGECFVLVRFRDGFEERLGEEWKAKHWTTQWFHYPVDEPENDIVAYKVVS